MWPCCKTQASGDTPFTCFISVVFIAATDRLGSGGILSSRPGVQCPRSLQVLQGTRAPCGLSGKMLVKHLWVLFTFARAFLGFFFFLVFIQSIWIHLKASLGYKRYVSRIDPCDGTVCVLIVVVVTQRYTYDKKSHRTMDIHTHTNECIYNC